MLTVLLKISVVTFSLMLLMQLNVFAQSDDLTKRLGRAATLISENHEPEAERELAAILKSKPNEPLALNLLGTVRAKQGRLDEAESLFSRALRIDKEFVGAHKNLAYLYLLKGQPEKTVLELKEIVRLKPDDADASYKLAHLLFALGHLDDCINFIEANRQSHAPTVPLITLLGDAYQKKGSLEKAEESYLQALSAQSNDAEALVGLAAVSQAKGDGKRAALYLARAKESMTDSPDLLYRFAVAALRSEMFDDAKRALERAVELKPDEASYLVALGAVWLKKPDLFEAERIFRRALELQPEDAQAEMYLGYTLLKQKKLPEARGWLEKSVRKDAVPPETFYYLGLIAQEQNEDERAIELFEKAVRLLPSFSNAHIALGSTYLKLKNYTRAQSELETGVKLKPDDSKAHYNLARLYAQLKDQRRAQEEMAIVEKLKSANNSGTQEGDVSAPSSPR
jgi:protein O-GlcNAc transferase